MQSVVPFFEEFARGPRKLQAANYKDVGDQLRASILVSARRSGWLDHIGGYPNDQLHREPAASFRLDFDARGSSL
jgi:hypothetical protein